MSSYLDNYMSKQRDLRSRSFLLSLDKHVPTLRMPQPSQQNTEPVKKIDTGGNALGWLASQLVTPAEREAQERRLQEQKAKMSLWAGLFDGFRQLGNLYYTSRGARPQQFRYNPYQQINDHINDQRQRIDNFQRNQQAYAKMLYDIERQGLEEARRQALTEAQINYYNTRDWSARQRTDKDNELKDERIAKTHAETGLIPYKKDEIVSRTNRNKRTGFGGGRSGSGSGGSRSTYGYKTTSTKHHDPSTGDVITTTERIPTTGNQAGVATTTTKTRKGAKKNKLGL